MFGSLKRLFIGSSKEIDWEQEAMVLDAIEKVVNGVDPRLRVVSNYKRKLRKGVKRSLEYIDQEVVSRLPEPVQVNRKSFGADPRVRAFFASAEELQRIFSHNKILREFFKHPENQALTESYALLGMRKQEKNILGAALQGDMVVRDVAQVAVNFSEHLIVAPAATELGTKRILRALAFNDLIARSLERITDRRLEKRRLEEQRHLLQLKLKALQAPDRSLKSQLEVPRQAGDIEVAQRQLAEVDLKLEKSLVDFGTLDAHLYQVKEVFKHPEMYLRIDEISMRLNRMGIKLAENSGKPGNDISFNEITLGEDRRFVVQLVKYSRQDMLPEQGFLAGLDYWV